VILCAGGRRGCRTSPGWCVGSAPTQVAGDGAVAVGLSAATLSGRLPGRPTGRGTRILSSTAWNCVQSARCPAVISSDNGRHRPSALRWIFRGEPAAVNVEPFTPTTASASRPSSGDPRRRLVLQFGRHLPLYRRRQVRGAGSGGVLVRSPGVRPRRPSCDSRGWTAQHASRRPDQPMPARITSRDRRGQALVRLQDESAAWIALLGLLAEAVVGVKGSDVHAAGSPRRST